MAINIPVMLGTAAATYGAGRMLMRDKKKEEEKPAPAPAAAPARAPAAAPAPKEPSAAMKAKARVRPGSEGVPEEKKSSTRLAFEKAFKAARFMGETVFEFPPGSGRRFSSRLSGESKEKHQERMKDAAAQTRMEDRLKRMVDRRKQKPEE